MSVPDSEGLIHSFVEPNGGALLLSAVFNALLYGITVLQTYIYYDRYWNDRSLLKVFVGVLATFDTVQIVFSIYSAWWSLVTNYGNFQSIELIPPGIAADIAVTICMGLLVQSFFAMRVWRTSQGNMIIPILIIGLSLAQFAFGIFYATFIERTQFAPALSEVSWAAATGLACSMTADFLITISLCCYLRRFSSGLLKSDRLISVIIMYIVNTGLLTSVVAVFAIVLTVAFSESLWLAIPFSLVSKCYVNSVLSTLNARANLRNIHSGPPLDHSAFVHYESTQPDRPSALVVSEVRLAAPVYSVPSKKLTSYGMVISV